MQKDIPEGYRQDSKGRLIPQDMVKPIDALRDELIDNIIGRARGVRETLSEFKQQTLHEVAAFIEVSALEHNVRMGGRKGNVVLTSFDGLKKITRTNNPFKIFNESILTAKELIDECLREWTEGSRSEIKALIDNAFQVDKEGNLSMDRIIPLRNLNIQDEKWQRAMDALNESIQIAYSKTYLRVYERSSVDEPWRAVSLDVAEV